LEYTEWLTYHLSILRGNWACCADPDRSAGATSKWECSYSPQMLNSTLYSMKKYNIIYADPPWNLQYLKETKRGINVYDLPYQTMSLKDICELKVTEICEANAILFLWVTDNYLPYMSKVMNSWGFEYVTVGFVWNKTAKTTSGVNATLSKYTRKSCEFCYIGKRGKYLVKNPGIVDQYIGTPKGRHSRKPDDVRNRIVEMCGDLPRIELFARPLTPMWPTMPGWDVFGNEVENTISITKASTGQAG